MLNGEDILAWNDNYWDLNIEILENRWCFMKNEYIDGDLANKLRFSI